MLNWFYNVKEENLVEQDSLNKLYLQSKYPEKNMKKSLVVILVLSLLILSLCACNNSGQNIEAKKDHQTTLTPTNIYQDAYGNVMIKIDGISDYLEDLEGSFTLQASMENGTNFKNLKNIKEDYFQFLKFNQSKSSFTYQDGTTAPTPNGQINVKVKIAENTNYKEFEFSNSLKLQYLSTETNINYLPGKALQTLEPSSDGFAEDRTITYSLIYDNGNKELTICQRSYDEYDEDIEKYPYTLEELEGIEYMFVYDTQIDDSLIEKVNTFEEYSFINYNKGISIDLSQIGKVSLVVRFKSNATNKTYTSPAFYFSFNI